MLHWTAYLLSYQQHECLVCTLKIFLFACIFIDIVCYRIRICLGYDLVWFAIRIDVYLSITHINEEHNAIAGAKFSFIGRFRMVCCRFVHKVRCHTQYIAITGSLLHSLRQLCLLTFSQHICIIFDYHFMLVTIRIIPILLRCLSSHYTITSHNPKQQYDHYSDHHSGNYRSTHDDHLPYTQTVEVVLWTSGCG